MNPNKRHKSLSPGNPCPDSCPTISTLSQFASPLEFLDLELLRTILVANEHLGLFGQILSIGSERP